MLKTHRRRPTDVPPPEPGPICSHELHQRVAGVTLHMMAEGPKAELGRQLVELGARLQREAREHY